MKYDVTEHKDLPPPAELDVIEHKDLPTPLELVVMKIKDLPLPMELAVTKNNDIPHSVEWRFASKLLFFLNINTYVVTWSPEGNTLFFFFIP